MRVITLGISHKTAPVALRERLASCGQRVESLSHAFRSQFPEAELVVLSTCNRVEFYVARPSHQAPARDELLAFVAQATGSQAADLQPTCVYLEDERALEHLFRVCVGLESMVLGEPQIIGQVKRAYEQAIESDAVGSALHRTFQNAIATAKRIRHETGIGDGRVSVGTVAVDFARQIFETFADKTVLGIGAGEMSKVMLTHLKALEPRRLWLTNRSAQRAEDLANELGITAPFGGPQPIAQLDHLLVEADIVLTSTGSVEPILTAERLKPLMKRRGHRPLFMVDVAVPRDIEESVGKLSDVYLYNIDDLAEVVTRTVRQRGGQVEACEALIAKGVDACWASIQNHDAGQVIRQLRSRLHELGQLESDRTLRKMTALPEDQLDDRLEALLQEHTHRLVNKILHLPLRQVDQKHNDTHVSFYIGALRRLFDLPDEDGGPTEAAPSSETKAESDTPEATNRPEASAADSASSSRQADATK